MTKLKTLVYAMLTAITSSLMVSCGGSTGSSSKNCMIFGEVPSLCADYQAKRDKIEESALESKASFKKASAQIDELKEEYRAKIEEAGKKLDGQPIEIAPGEDFKVVKPISISFKQFANNVSAQFTVHGEVESAKNITIDVTESWLRSHNVEYLYVPLLLVGCDEQGEEVTSTRIGVFKGFQVIDGKLVLPEGIKAELQTTFYNNYNDSYLKVKSVKLALDTTKI